SVNFRAQEAPVSEPLGWPYEFRAIKDEYQIHLCDSPLPPLRMKLRAQQPAFTLKANRLQSVLYPVEESRGYQARGDLWSPGYFLFALQAREPATFAASTESSSTMSALHPNNALDAERGRRRRLLTLASPVARDGVPAELVLAADQFIVTPAGRTEETARAHAYGDEVRTLIARYHCFPACARDTMISLA